RPEDILALRLGLRFVSIPKPGDGFTSSLKGLLDFLDCLADPLEEIVLVQNDSKLFFVNEVEQRPTFPSSYFFSEKVVLDTHDFVTEPSSAGERSITL